MPTFEKNETFVTAVAAKIDQNPGKFIRATTEEMSVHHKTISKTVTEDLGIKSFAMRNGQLLKDAMKVTRKVKAAALLSNLKHETAGLIGFFSDE